MIDEEFYRGKKSSESEDGVPVARPQNENADSASDEAAFSEEEKTVSEQAESPAVDSDDGEPKKKLSKKAKLIYFAVFAMIICAAMAGGIIISVKTPEKVTKPFEYSSQYAEQTLNASGSETQIHAEPLTVPSEPVTVPRPTVPTASVNTTAPLASESIIPSASEAKKPDAQITGITVNVDEFSRFAKILYAFGFLYDPEQNMFYSQNDPWQRNLGYTSLYDDISVLGNMYYDTVRFNFKYGDKKWLYQIWKGRYGATSGCEMGVYYQDRRTDNKQFYYVPTDSDPLPGMYFELYRYEDLLFTNGPARHWWLTGFRLLDSSGSDALHMICKFYMPNKTICDEFEKSVREQCAQLDNLSYSRSENVITLDWAY